MPEVSNPSEVLSGATVVSCEVCAYGETWGYIVVRFDNGVALYADAPSVHAVPPLEVPTV